MRCKNVMHKYLIPPSEEVIYFGVNQVELVNFVLFYLIHFANTIKFDDNETILIVTNSFRIVPTEK